MSGGLGEARGSTVDPVFVALTRSWMRNPAEQVLGFVWAGYDSFRASAPNVNPADLERSITQLLEPRIRDAMSGFEPFYVQHGPFERETMKAPPAQPPEYDLAFILRADERVMWPLEAKVLETPKQVANYVRDVNDEFLTCRYAPFSNSGAMLGYLLSGTPTEAFLSIAKSLRCTLDDIPDQLQRPNRLSQHQRMVPAGKPYPSLFSCYHIVMEFPDLKRSPKST